MLKRLLFTCLLLLSFNTWAYSFVIQDIEVEGLQRIDIGTVYNDLPVQVGDTFYPSQSNEIIRSLYASGYYANIGLAQEDNTLIVIIEERPTIGSITITGNKDVKAEDLREGLSYAGIQEGYPYDPSVLDRVTTELEYQYFSHGKYSVSVTSRVSDLPRNRVAIDINIVEGGATKIRQINFVGNRAFTDKQLSKTFASTTPGLFTWLSKSDQYSRERLMGDLENLRSHYMNHGYLNVDISSTQVAIVPSRDDIYITVNIDEGDQYRISETSIAGDMVVSEEELSRYLVFEEGEIFSREKVMYVNEIMTNRVGNEGYAFVEINPVTTIDEENKTVAITFYIQANQLVYVRNIVFSGNYMTREEVMRREMTQLEGALVSTAKIQRSRNNLYLLGYLENINIETVPIPGYDDLVDLHVSAEERPSGQLTGGVGYSQLDGFLFNVGITQNNFFGSGNIVNFMFNKSEYFTSYNISYTNPYYTPDGISRGFNVFYTETDLGEADISNYTRDVWGGMVNYGIPVNPNNRISFGFGYENISLTVSDNPATVSDEILSFIEDNGKNFDTFRVNTGWSRSTLDRAVFPTRGSTNSASISAAVPGSTLTYYKTTVNSRWYTPIPMGDDWVFMMRGMVGYGDGYLDNGELPFYENFYLGGIQSLRGFRDYWVGPKDSLGDPIGGNFRYNGSAELLFPIPFVEVNSIRTSVFIDAGSLFDTYNETIDFGMTRVSAGAGFQWYSPLGPLVFSFATPLKKESGDREQFFQFSIGTVM